jgi:hypothetical protein
VVSDLAGLVLALLGGRVVPRVSGELLDEAAVRAVHDEPAGGQQGGDESDPGQHLVVGVDHAAHPIAVQPHVEALGAGVDGDPPRRPELVDGGGEPGAQLDEYSASVSCRRATFGSWRYSRGDDEAAIATAIRRALADA